MDERKIDAALETARWWQKFRATNNDTFLPLLFDKHRYLVLKGGGGSGKSIFAGRKILERVTTEPGHRWLVCRKVARTLRESCFKQLIGQLSEHYPDSGYKINRSDMAISFPNGSEILFAGLDDVEKLKSIYNITGIWTEEASELLEGDFNQLDIRLRGETKYYKQIIISFNPIHIHHWLKKRFFDRQDERARVHESTYKDNRFLDEEAIRTLESFRETDEYYYMVYCLGQWGVTGKTVFNGKAVAERLAIAEKIVPEGRGLFTYTEDEDGVHIRDEGWEEDEDGPIILYEKPKKGRQYVIGGDTAGDGSDWFVAQVLDNLTGKQVAVLRHHYDEDTYARQVYCLGHYYNTALVGIEANFSTYPIKLLGLMGYEKQYVREMEDEYTGALKKSFGFKTTTNTRQVIIAGLIKEMRTRMDTVNHPETLMEMLTFVRNEKLRPEAEEGAHDDCIMSLAIAHYIRPQQGANFEAEKEFGAGWTSDMWQDYREASAEEKAYLRKKWG